MTEELNKITVLVVEPEKRPYIKEIEAELSSYQHEVGGYIEVVYPYEDPVGLICNEEGKLEGLPLNRVLRDDEGHIYDAIAGTFLVVGLTEEDFTSLTDEQIEKFSDLFKYPELFTRINGKIIVTPVLNDPEFPDRTLSIYQINDNPEFTSMRFMNYDYLTSFHYSIDSSRYDKVYTGPMKAGESLEDVYARFNLNHPKDFKGYSLSVSDVIVVHENGKDSAYFVDSFGFKTLPDFFKQPEISVSMDTQGLEIKGHIGTWHAIDHITVEDKSFYLMEHDTYGDEVACIIVDEQGGLVLDQVYDSFDEYILSQLKLELMPIESPPDPSISTESMKEYGYSWGGMLPLNTDTAKKFMDCCPIYCLHVDNSEGLLTDLSELEEHSSHGGIFGIEKTDWLAYQKRSLDKQISEASLSPKNQQIPDTREQEPEL